MKTRSQKKEATDRKVSNIMAELMSEHDGLCTGCGGRRPLDPSHIIRRSLAPHLVTNKNNIKPHCRTCHNKWDSGDLWQMIELWDFFDNLEAIEKIEPKYYMVISHRLKDKLFDDKYFFTVYNQKQNEDRLRKLKKQHGITG